MFADLKVQHPLNQGALELRPGAPKDPEPRPGHLRRPNEVEDAQGFSDFVVGRRVVVGRWGSAAVMYPAGVVRIAHGRRGVGKHGDFQQQPVDGGLNPGQLGFALAKLLGQAACPCDQGRALAAGRLADAARNLAALGAKALDRGQQPAALVVEPEQFIQREVAAARGQTLAH